MRTRTLAQFTATSITAVASPGAWVDASNVIRAGAIVNVSLGTGATAGNIVMQVSDYIAVGAALTLPLPTAAIIAAGVATAATVPVSGNGTYQIPPTELCSRWVRLVYTPTGGQNIGQLDGNMNLVGWP